MVIIKFNDLMGYLDCITLHKLRKYSVTNIPSIYFHRNKT